ncbi:MAG: phosphodiester glycosidase family protein [Mycobacteriales bacterium]
MAPQTHRRARAIAVAATLSIAAGFEPVSLAHASGGGFGWGTGSCPAAETLVSGTAWHTHKIAPSITLAEGNRTDDGGRGLVKMHVLSITVGRRGVSFRPLMHAVAQRTPLSRLAAGHKHLVAAVNTGYFDFNTGDPTQPLIVGGKPLVISTKPQPVLGFDSAGALQTGTVHLHANLYVGNNVHSVGSINEVKSGSGLDSYNSAWGGHPIPSGWQSDARSVVANRLGGNGSSDPVVPSGGFELLGQGRPASQWLSSQPSGAKTGIVGKVVTTTNHPFVQAYGVGAEVVESKGVTRSGLPCHTANTRTPARTAYGVADGGKVLVIAEVEDHPGTNVHGLDEDQMSGLMAQLGVDRAFDVDGSGSTEMLVRMPHSSGLSLRTYPADGKERPMPVGLGISYVKPRAHKHHHHR